MTATNLEELTRKLRADVVSMIGEAASGHPGGSLSAVDILAVLYERVMRVDPGNPRWEDRDRLVLSKGHAAPALYAVLAHRGFFPHADLLTLRKLGSPLQGHPDSRKTPGVDVSTGSLGQGLSAAVGLALAARVTRRDYHVFCLLGDGECQEGQVWEAGMAAAHYRLGNLTAIVDFNGLQIDGPVDRVMSLGDFRGKWRAFGWEVQEVDGHDLKALEQVLSRRGDEDGPPLLVVARTIKGKGVSFMENRVEWHGTAPTREQVDHALAELGGVCCG